MIRKFINWLLRLFKRRKHCKESLQGITISKEKPKHNKFKENKTALNSIMTSRPPEMSYEKYKKLLAEQNKIIKNYLRGRLIYKSSKLVTDYVYDKKSNQYVNKTMKRTWPPLVRTLNTNY